MSHPKLNIPFLYQNPTINTDDSNGDFILDIIVYLQSSLTITDVNGKEVNNGIYKVTVSTGKGNNENDHYEFTQFSVPTTKRHKLEVEVDSLDSTEPLGKNTIAIRDFNDDDNDSEQEQ